MNSQTDQTEEEETQESLSHQSSLESQSNQENDTQMDIENELSDVEANSLDINTDQEIEIENENEPDNQSYTGSISYSEISAPNNNEENNYSISSIEENKNNNELLNESDYDSYYTSETQPSESLGSQDTNETEIEIIPRKRKKQKIYVDYIEEKPSISYHPPSPPTVHEKVSFSLPVNQQHVQSHSSFQLKPPQKVEKKLNSSSSSLNNHQNDQTPKKISAANVEL